MPSKHAIIPATHNTYGALLMPILFQSLILRRDLQANPWALYIFGDNLARIGLGGQAKEMRGEPNALGLPTKRSPSVFLKDEDLPEIEKYNQARVLLIPKLLLERKTIIWPLDGIGTGLAQLATRAPVIAKYYQDRLAKWRTI